MIQQIKRDLAAIDEALTNQAQELENIYITYLKKLSQSTAKQLILASYQICTQTYPESFLKLSFNQREKLQKDLQKLGQEIDVQLSSSLEKAKSDDETETEKYDWYIQIDENINEVLENISRQVNRYLQKAGILPTKLPAKLLDIAMESEDNDSTIGSPPNLLNLLIENEQLEDEGNISITAIRLRLPEIEFAESSLINDRNQIRNLVAKINQLQQQYRKKSHLLAKAEAESAWRSSWSES